MFRKRLLLATALLIVPTIDSAGAHSIAIASKEDLAARRHMNAILSNPGKDRNTEFLCTYGSYSVYDYRYFSSASQVSGWQNVAVPIRGHGKTVGTIVVENSASPAASFTVGIYSNTPSGTPGQLIAGGVAKARPTCKRKSVAISPTVLNAGEKYWVEETVSKIGYGYNGVLWAIDPNARNKAYSQHHEYFASSSSQYSYTSHWRRIKTGPAPYFRVK
jgi:hypothetical protein